MILWWSWVFCHCFSDEKSELGYEELMNEAYLLRSLQEKVKDELDM